MSFDADRRFVIAARAFVLVALIVFWGGVVFACFGCAAASVDPDGTVRGFAAAGGHVERCVPRGEAGLVTSAPQECVRIEAQSLPSAIFGMLASVGSALLGMF